MDTPLRTRVERGAQLLDEIEPGWFQRIDLTDLDLSDPTCCVLGQIYEDFSNGVHVIEVRFPDVPHRFLDEAHDWYIETGFDIAGSESSEIFEELTVAWQALIQARNERS